MLPVPLLASGRFLQLSTPRLQSLLTGIRSCVAALQVVYTRTDQPRVTSSSLVLA